MPLVSVRSDPHGVVPDVLMLRGQCSDALVVAQAEAPLPLEESPGAVRAQRRVLPLRPAVLAGRGGKVNASAVPVSAPAAAAAVDVGQRRLRHRCSSLGGYCWHRRYRPPPLPC